ncbi:MAG: DEAD/DEAH box helicase family protein [Ectothiorhodospiraceae bacterium AqS1]|nr:DEAD/DEAH box helicase family protein [Ectothiorhodospiraceae bacterium AqS1]
MTVRVLFVEKQKSDALELTYELPSGKIDKALLYRDDEKRLEIKNPDRSWSFDEDGALFRLVSEAKRISLAHLFDPMPAVYSSDIEPLPHQIAAVYETMLPRRPLRFLLADDPGAGKTIMAGLLIKELMARGDLKRCLVVCPGPLAEQWQGELANRFSLSFDIPTKEQLDMTSGGNCFAKHNLVIARLDQLSRNKNSRAKLEPPETRWDLIVCDEAHKMSATYSGGEIRYTKRYRLGKFLSTLTRHFLLLTATPHNGKEEDFQAFMALLDGDRFQGRYRPEYHRSDVSDLMRRMVKENLLTFDGKPLFPQRIAHTIGFELSQDEARLYNEVTDYVRKEFDRAEASEMGKRISTVGFALTILQRRLASSPEAIHRSLQRRRERLEKRLKEVKRSSHLDASDIETASHSKGSQPDAKIIDDWEDIPESDHEDADKDIYDRATAARTIPEIEVEIRTLRSLEDLAYQVKESGQDQKWNELAGLLETIFTKEKPVLDQVSESDAFYGGYENIQPKYSAQQKLIVFTEHRDTLDYLHRRIDTLFGRPQATVIIHGGVKREDRIEVQEKFKNDPEVRVLLATDAAGEGINLQRAHLMVNYDLPWNPNRLEQRFGRIHRIGQTEICHLWNLVAKGTREGDVYQRLLEKIDQIQKTLGDRGGKIFDTLGKLHFNGKSLRDLMMEAIRNGEREEVQEQLNAAIDSTLDQMPLQDRVEESILARETMDDARIQSIRQNMERSEIRRLQPHAIKPFFCEAFERLGGQIMQREPHRYELPNVPISIRNHDRSIDQGKRAKWYYQRIVFEKELITVPGKPSAEFICPGHPLLDAVVGATLDRYRDILKHGAILVDEHDIGKNPRVLFYLEHTVCDGISDGKGDHRPVSRHLLYVEIDEEGNIRRLQYAPYLDYRPLRDADEEDPDIDTILDSPQCAWIDGELESKVKEYVIEKIAPEHIREVRDSRQDLIDKTRSEVKDRLTKEISHWDRRAAGLGFNEEMGIESKGTGLNAAMARRRVEDFRERMRARLQELELQERITASPPTVLGCALVIPQGLLRCLQGSETIPDRSSPDIEALAARARGITMEFEKTLGNSPMDRENEKLGYDIESKTPDGHLRFIKVKGRVGAAPTIPMTRNEILFSLNKPDSYILSIVEFFENGDHDVRYVRRPCRENLESPAPDLLGTLVRLDPRPDHKG